MCVPTTCAPQNVLRTTHDNIQTQSNGGKPYVPHVHLYANWTAPLLLTFYLQQHNTSHTTIMCIQQTLLLLYHSYNTYNNDTITRA